MVYMSCHQEMELNESKRDKRDGTCQCQYWYARAPFTCAPLRRSAPTRSLQHDTHVQCTPVPPPLSYSNGSRSTSSHTSQLNSPRQFRIVNCQHASYHPQISQLDTTELIPMVHSPPLHLV